MLLYTKELLVQRGRHENEEGRLLEGGPSSKVFTRRLHTQPTVQPCLYVEGLDMSYLFVTANSGKKVLQQHVQHMMCEAAHFMKTIPEIWKWCQMTPSCLFCTRPARLGLFEKSWERIYCCFTSKTALTQHTRPR